MRQSNNKINKIKNFAYKYCLPGLKYLTYIIVCAGIIPFIFDAYGEHQIDKEMQDFIIDQIYNDVSRNDFSLAYYNFLYLDGKDLTVMSGTINKNKPYAIYIYDNNSSNDPYVLLNSIDHYNLITGITSTDMLYMNAQNFNINKSNIQIAYLSNPIIPYYLSMSMFTYDGYLDNCKYLHNETLKTAIYEYYRCMRCIEQDMQYLRAKNNTVTSNTEDFHRYMDLRFNVMKASSVSLLILSSKPTSDMQYSNFILEYYP